MERAPRSKNGEGFTQKLKTFLKENPWATLAQMATHLGRNEKYAQVLLSKLYLSGDVVKQVRYKVK